jgi:hypothetical protein
MSFLLPGATWRCPPSESCVVLSHELSERKRTVRICEEYNTFKVITPDVESPHVTNVGGFMVDSTTSGINMVHKGIFDVPTTSSQMSISPRIRHQTPVTTPTPDIQQGLECTPIEYSNFIKRRKVTK